MKYEEIRQNGVLYLKRWRLISTKWFGIYLHRFYRPDDDRDLHSHPWSWCASLLLSGWYIEQVGKIGKGKLQKQGDYWHIKRTLERNERLYTAGSLRFFRGDKYHAVSEIKPAGTWTLFAHGPLVREWGFFDEQLGQHVSWKHYLVNKGLLTREQVAEKARVGAEYE